jgi:hypothetical protein
MYCMRVKYSPDYAKVDTEAVSGKATTLVCTGVCTGIATVIMLPTGSAQSF